MEMRRSTAHPAPQKKRAKINKEMPKKRSTPIASMIIITVTTISIIIMCGFVVITVTTLILVIVTIIIVVFIRHHPSSSPSSYHYLPSPCIIIAIVTTQPPVILRHAKEHGQLRWREDLGQGTNSSLEGHRAILPLTQAVLSKFDPAFFRRNQDRCVKTSPRNASLPFSRLAVHRESLYRQLCRSEVPRALIMREGD